MQFRQTVVRNSAFGLAAQFAIKILAFAFSVLVVRKLGAESYGQYAGVLAFGALFVFVADLGLSPFLVREIARQRDAPDGKAHAETLYGEVLRLRILLSLIAAGLIVTAGVVTGRPPMMLGALALGTLGLVMYAVQGTSGAVLSGFERMGLTAGSGVLNQVVFVAVGSVMIWTGQGYYGLIVANLLGIATITWLCWRAVQRLGVRPRPSGMRSWPSLLRASAPFGIVSFTLGLSYKFDSVLLNVTRTNLETGYYNAAYNLVFSAALLSNVFNTALFPSLVRRMTASSHGLAGVCEHAIRYLMVLALPIALGACLVAERLVPFLYGGTYLPTIPALQIVIWALPLMFTTELLGYIAVVQNRERRVARAIMISTGLNIGVNLLLVPRYGLFAAAGMTVVTEAVLAGQYAWMLRDTLRQVDFERPLIRPLIACGGMGLVVVLLNDVPLLLQIAAGGVAYCGLLVVLGVVGRQDLALFDAFRVRRPVDPTAPAPQPADVAA